MIAWKTRAEDLVARLAETGAVRDPAWRAAFAGTPRHVFVPRFYALDRYAQPRTLLDGAEPGRRETWLDAVYSDNVLVTHFETIDGALLPDGQPVRIATSSASMPRIVAVMLDRLQVADGHRVLEIGTGTGYNAALLCARLGDDKVTSVEVDPATAAEAAGHLAEAGYRPTLVVGDGAGGHADGAPYDRIIATCAVSRIPAAWIEQLADDGVIVAPLTLQGGLAVLRKTAPGQVSGRLDAEPAYFMTMRPADPGDDDGRVDVPGFHGPVSLTTTGTPVTAWQDLDFRLWLDLHLPAGRIADRFDDGSGRTGVTVYTLDARAEVDYRRGEEGAWPVRQEAARLWDTVEAAWQRWQRHRRPGRTRIGLTATTGDAAGTAGGDEGAARAAGGDQFAWLDDPDGPLRWPLPGR